MSTNDANITKELMDNMISVKNIQGIPRTSFICAICDYKAVSENNATKRKFITV